MNVDIKEWHKIGNWLTDYFGICSCQRKLKSIVDNLYEILTKVKDRDYNFTGAEWLIIAMLDKNSDVINHGINCEYPWLNEDSQLYKWLLETKDNPNLEDN